jgi:CMP-N-acetylneuraminic acid synthetase
MNNKLKKPVVAFLPCRRGSERVLRKNIKKFSNYSFGLIEIKLTQLLTCRRISQIVLSTNDNEIIDFALSLKNKKILIDKRSDQLSSSSTSTDELIDYCHSLISDAHILWTHVTSPFVNAEKYSEIIVKYFACLDAGYDSLMTATPIYDFIWNEYEPINYDPVIEKWPRTQSLKKLFHINSAAFLASKDIYLKYNNRIGKNPFLYSLSRIEGFDIDWEEDFILAEQLLIKKIISV